MTGFKIYGDFSVSTTICFCLCLCLLGGGGGGGGCQQGDAKVMCSTGQNLRPIASRSEALLYRLSQNAIFNMFKDTCFVGGERFPFDTKDHGGCWSIWTFEGTPGIWQSIRRRFSWVEKVRCFRSARRFADAGTCSCQNVKTANGQHALPAESWCRWNYFSSFLP